MPRSYIIDSSALVAWLDQREEHHAWAQRTLGALPVPWLTCEAVVTESFYLLEGIAGRSLRELLRAETLRLAFALDADLTSVLALMEKYADVPMSLADACVVRMSEILPDPVVLTTDRDFRVYRRHSRQVIPCLLP